MDGREILAEKIASYWRKNNFWVSRLDREFKIFGSEEQALADFKEQLRKELDAGKIIKMGIFGQEIIREEDLKFVYQNQRPLHYQVIDLSLDMTSLREFEICQAEFIPKLG